MEIIGSLQSAYQHIMLIRQGPFTELVLDGRPQTTLPNNAYYEMLLGAVPVDSRVLVLGGGDLTCVDVFKRKNIHDWKMVEIDEDVIKMCEIFCPHKRNTWENNVEIGDAFEHLQKGYTYEHIIVDLLSFAYFDALSTSMTIYDFCKALKACATKTVSAYVGTGAGGVVGALAVLPLFRKLGMDPKILMSELGELFIWVSVCDAPLPLTPLQTSQVITYGATVKDDRFYDYSPEERLIMARSV